MAGSTTTLLLLGVCLWLISSINAQSFTISYTNIASVGASSAINVEFTTPTFTGPVVLSLSVTPPNIAVIPAFSSQTLTFLTNASTLNFFVEGLSVGVAQLNFSSSSPGVTVPSISQIFVLVNAAINGNKNLYPGTSVQGLVSLDAAPAVALTATLSSSTNVTITPSSLVFTAGQTPYSQPFTLTSTEPGTYVVSLALSGPDAVAGFAGPNSNITLTVAPRLVYGEASSSLSLNVGDASGAILIYLDVPVDQSLTVTVNASDPSVVANPTSLTFIPSVLTLTFTVTGSIPGSYLLSYQLSGPDSSIYAFSSLPSVVTFANRMLFLR